MTAKSKTIKFNENKRRAKKARLKKQERLCKGGR